jgi:hypothetical protein
MNPKSMVQDLSLRSGVPKQLQKLPLSIRTIRRIIVVYKCPSLDSILKLVQANLYMRTPFSCQF